MTPVLVDSWHAAIRVRFDEPERRNPFDLAAIDIVRSTLSDDPSATVVLGSTEPHIFSAGADLRADDAQRYEISDALYECYRVMITRPGLVLAVVEGAAVGGGAHLAAAADVRLSGPQARWRWVGLAHGLAVGGWILPALVGRGRAMELVLSSRWIGADEAARIGLANAPTDDAWLAAAQLVDRVAGLDRQALARLKQLSLHSDLVTALNAEQDGNRGWDGHVPNEAVRAVRGGDRP